MSFWLFLCAEEARAHTHEHEDGSTLSVDEERDTILHHKFSYSAISWCRFQFETL